MLVVVGGAAVVVVVDGAAVVVVGAAVAVVVVVSRAGARVVEVDGVELAGTFVTGGSGCEVAPLHADTNTAAAVATSAQRGV